MGFSSLPGNFNGTTPLFEWKIFIAHTNDIMPYTNCCFFLAISTYSFVQFCHTEASAPMAFHFLACLTVPKVGLDWYIINH